MTPGHGQSSNFELCDQNLCENYNFAFFSMEKFEMLAMVMVKSFQPTDHGNWSKGQQIVVVEVPG